MLASYCVFAFNCLITASSKYKQEGWITHFKFLPFGGLMERCYEALWTTNWNNNNKAVFLNNMPIPVSSQFEFFIFQSFVYISAPSLQCASRVKQADQIFISNLTILKFKNIDQTLRLLKFSVIFIYCRKIIYKDIYKTIIKIWMHLDTGSICILPWVINK